MLSGCELLGLIAGCTKLLPSVGLCLPPIWEVQPLFLQAFLRAALSPLLETKGLARVPATFLSGVRVKNDIDLSSRALTLPSIGSTEPSWGLFALVISVGIQSQPGEGEGGAAGVSESGQAAAVPQWAG